MPGSIVRVCAVLQLSSGTYGNWLAGLTVDPEHAVPTPDGYSFVMDDVDRCYEAPSDVPPGYNLSTGKKCAGTSLITWEDGTPSHFGELGDNSAWGNILECARICNFHNDCDGFYSVNGICSHWQGNLQGQQDPPMSDASGYDCYTNTRSDLRDLIYITEHEPTPPEPVPEPAQGQPQISDCLCVFDVDRTLTAKQVNPVRSSEVQNDCPGTQEFPELFDGSYNSGALILSELALRMNQSFCGQCYFAIVSAGIASGPKSKSRELIDSLVDPKYNIGGWVDGCSTPSWGTKLMCCGEGHEKGRAVHDVVTWMGSKGIRIADEKVHFYDDKVDNIKGLEEYPFNAHQISCGSRDGSRGRCGGTYSEIVDTPGQHFCEYNVV